MTIYNVIKILSKDLVVVNSIEYGNQMFSKVKLRKATTCQQTRIKIEKGQFAWRPQTNTYNRGERISLEGMISLIAIK